MDSPTENTPSNPPEAAATEAAPRLAELDKMSPVMRAYVETETTELIKRMKKRAKEVGLNWQPPKKGTANYLVLMSIGLDLVCARKYSCLI